jgi:hypothetical protein
VPPPKTQFEALNWLVHRDSDTPTAAQPTSSSNSQ